MRSAWGRVIAAFPGHLLAHPPPWHTGCAATLEYRRFGTSTAVNGGMLLHRTSASRERLKNNAPRFVQKSLNSAPKQERS
jgi:hypothetical protein